MNNNSNTVEVPKSEVMPQVMVVKRLSALLMQRANCIENENEFWLGKSEERIDEIVMKFMPRGSGFDTGTQIDLDKSHGEKIVFNTSYHHMDDSGSYDGWTHHRITVTASLFDVFNMTISGRNRNGIKDYIHDCFYRSLREMVNKHDVPR